MRSWMIGKERLSLGWADLVVVPLVAVLSVPGLVFFGRNWTVVDVGDSARYLMAGSQFISGQSFEGVGQLAEYNGVHGPGLPALIGFLIPFFGHDPESLAWATRLMALLIPLLAYLLVKRISSPVAGLIAAALVSLLGYTADSVIAISIDPLMLMFYLLVQAYTDARWGAVAAGVIALVMLYGFVQSPKVDAWRTGAEGERATARDLDGLGAAGFVVLHDRRVPGYGGNIDHVAIGPTGVWAIEMCRRRGIMIILRASTR